MDFPFANLRLAPSMCFLVGLKGTVISAAPRDTEAEKARIRIEARANRDALSSGLGSAAAAGIAARFTSTPELVSHTGIGTVIAGYMPAGSEVDPQTLMRRLFARGAALCLPYVETPAAPLIFRRWDIGEELQAGAYGIQVPCQSAEAVSPNLLLVPILAFDRKGYRLGYGGGFYDRTIAELRTLKQIVTVGLAFSGQVRDDLPIEAHDMRLDWIVTESAALRVAG